MPRLFVSPRELNFLSDITKELITDIVGQKIYYYPINEFKTKTHDLYQEALTKIYDNPIELNCLVDAQFHEQTKINQFGVDAQYRLEVFVQYRDLIDRGISISIGDCFSFSSLFYEITDVVTIKNIWGLAEHKDGVKITGTKARKSLFEAPVNGPTDYANTDPDAVQTTFVQQRGLPENKLGETNDVRALQETGVLEPPLTGAKEVSPLGNTSGNDTKSSFYDE